MIVLFIFLCIVLGLCIAPFLVIYFRKQNLKRLTRLKEIKEAIDEVRLEMQECDDKGERMAMLRKSLVIIHEAEDLFTAIQKTPDVSSKKLAEIVYAPIRQFYYAGNQQ